MSTLFIYTQEYCIRHNLCSARGMKLIKIPFIIAFALAAIAIGASYIFSLRSEAEPTEYLWYESLQGLHELCRAKHRQSHLYGEYARHAERDSLPVQAALLRALAFADGVQCANCRKAIESLGGRFHTPVVQTSTLQDTPTHLHLALQAKSAVREGIAQRCLHRAVEEGNRYIARLLTWCDASDIAQIVILQHVIEACDSEPTAPYQVCPTCGAISNSDLHTAYCPHCMTDRQEFHTFK